ncbi:MAG TPA: YbaN family protein [Burkholderiaceae bacterium]
METDAGPSFVRPRWRRVLWAVAGALALITGIVGIFVPLLPTTPFVLLAAFCFSRGSERCERWLLEHRRFGPIVRDWRARRAVPLRAKQFASVMMVLGSLWGAFALPIQVAWLPAAVCAATATWLWRLPTRKA